MRFFLFILLAPSILFSLEPLPDTSSKFIDRYCLDCHDEDMNEGGINLDFTKFNWQDAKVQHVWSDVYEMVSRGKMPPKKNIDKIPIPCE